MNSAAGGMADQGYKHCSSQEDGASLRIAQYERILREFAQCYKEK